MFSGSVSSMLRQRQRTRRLISLAVDLYSMFRRWTPTRRWRQPESQTRTVLSAPSSSPAAENSNPLPFFSFKADNPSLEDAMRHAAYIARPGFGILAREPALASDIHLTNIFLDHYKQGGELSIDDLISKTTRDLHDLLLSSIDALRNLSAVTLSVEELVEKSSSLMETGVLCGIELPVAEINSRELALRCKTCHTAGARFVICRADFRIEAADPSDDLILEKATQLAGFAFTFQRNGLVPIVHLDILVDGAHTVARCHEVTLEILQVCYNTLKVHQVVLSGTLLIINPVTPGAQSLHANVSAELVCAYTFSALRSCVPAEVPAVFLSCGRSQQETISILIALQSIIQNVKAPWQISFYVGNTMLNSTLSAWRGKEENTAAAKDAFSRMCSLCSELTTGMS